MRDSDEASFQISYLNCSGKEAKMINERVLSSFSVGYWSETRLRTGISIPCQGKHIGQHAEEIMHFVSQ